MPTNVEPMLKKNENAMWAKAMTLGLPRELVVPTVNAFQKWGHSSGWEFAISRFKLLKTNLLRVRAGLEPDWPMGSYPKRGISWYKGLVTLAQKNDALLSKVLSLLNIYTVIILSESTESQRSKFIEGVNSSPTRFSNKFMGRLLNYAAGRISVPPKVSSPKWMLNHIWSNSRRTPSVKASSDKLDLFVTSPEFGGVLDSLLFLLAGVKGSELLSWLDSYPETLGKSLNELHFLDSKSLVDKLGSLAPVEKPGLFGGSIGFIQEAGGKLRSVANPYRWWQSALDPLAVSIHEVLRGLPWDMTHNQHECIPEVRKSLGEGHEWFSVDISSATDHFPFEYQLKVLEQVFQGDEIALESISLFGAISRLPWWYKSSDGTIQTIKWQKGQPMGLRPSFGSFALTHGLVLLTLNQGRHQGDFYVLGDDVIIRGKELHRRYRAWLDMHEVPVSEAKCLQGSVAEFASQIILPNTVIPIRKWRSVTPDNFVDLARLWGPQSFKLFTRREQVVLNKLRRVPLLYGGLEWAEIADMDYTVPCWVEQRIGRKVDIDLVRQYLHQVYTSTVVASSGVLPRVDVGNVDSMENLMRLLGRLHFQMEINNYPLLKSMASNIVEEVDVHLPSADWDGKPKSSLDLWEQRLGL